MYAQQYLCQKVEELLMVDSILKHNPQLQKITANQHFMLQGKIKIVQDCVN